MAKKEADPQSTAVPEEAKQAALNMKGQAPDYAPFVYDAPVDTAPFEPHTAEARGVAVEQEAPAEAEDKTKEELYEEAKELDVSGRSTMSKEELAQAVEEEKK